MSPTSGKGKPRGARKLKEAMTILRAMGFGPKQSNEVAGYVLSPFSTLDPTTLGSAAQEPLRGITPIIDFVANKYRLRYAPNTRETIRDEAVKYFVEEGLLVKNPDDPSRPTNSGKTVYQIEPTALRLCRTFKTDAWDAALKRYLCHKKGHQARTAARQGNRPHSGASAVGRGNHAVAGRSEPAYQGVHRGLLHPVRSGRCRSLRWRRREQVPAF